MLGVGERRNDWPENGLLPAHAVLCGLLLLSAREASEKAKAEVRVADPGLQGSSAYRPAGLGVVTCHGCKQFGGEPGAGLAGVCSSAGSPGPHVVASSLLPGMLPNMFFGK